MQSSTESEVKTPRLFLTQNGACFMSPNLLPTDPGIDTPNKLPAAPHPSPINMDIEHLNPESKEMFRKQLLKACQLKIPEALENSSNIDDGVLANLSYTEVTSPVCKHIFTSLGKKDAEKNVFSDDKMSRPPEVDASGKLVRLYDKFEDDRDENENFKEFLPYVEHCSSNFNYDFVKTENGRSYLPKIIFTIENSVDQVSEEFRVSRCQTGNDNLHEFTDSKNVRPDAKLSPCEISYQNYSNENDSDHSNCHADSNVKPLNEGKEQSYLLDSIPGQERSVFYDSSTNCVDLSLLLDSNNVWNDSSSYRSRSPCSDKLSTVAHCASDASDISDGDFVNRDRSMEDFEEDYESSKDFGSSKEVRSKSFGSSKDFGVAKDCRPKKKLSENLVIRRFLRWRRCFKLRKRAASLDEGKFPFLANRFDSYKTEFELSV